MCRGAQGYKIGLVLVLRMSSRLIATGWLNWRQRRGSFDSAGKNGLWREYAFGSLGPPGMRFKDLLFRG